jgi:PHD/YefM family antitoxin component YafN of YafNO toxin-antitoxin module
MFYNSYSSHSGDLAARNAAREAKTDARETKSDVYFLKQELERQMMISEALWRFVKKEFELSDKDLFEKVLEIDAEDGRVDGKVSRQEGPKKCRVCDKTLPNRKNFCIYCGERYARDCFER